MEQKREVERDIEKDKRNRGEQRTRWRVREKEIHTRGEASTDHPLGEGLG